MKSILIIYENVPESTDAYLLSVTDAELDKIKQCAGCFINSSEDWKKKPTEWLSEFLQDKPKLDITKPFVIPTETTVVHTGFLL